MAELPPRSANVVWQQTQTTRGEPLGGARPRRRDRAADRPQRRRASRPSPQWSSGAGAPGRPAYMLDGDNIRHGLNGDLGFARRTAAENVRGTARGGRAVRRAGVVSLGLAGHRPYIADRKAGPRGSGRAGLPFVEVPSRPRSRSASGATPRASTPAPAPGDSTGSPASAPRTRRRSRPISAYVPDEPLDAAVDRVLALL